MFQLSRVERGGVAFFSGGIQDSVTRMLAGDMANISVSHTPDVPPRGFLQSCLWFALFTSSSKQLLQIIFVEYAFAAQPGINYAALWAVPFRLLKITLANPSLLVNAFVLLCANERFNCSNSILFSLPLLHLLLVLFIALALTALMSSIAQTSDDLVQGDLDIEL